MTEQDRVALIAFMRRIEKKLYRKLDGCVPAILWLGLRLAVRASTIKDSINGFCQRLAEPARTSAWRAICRAGIAVAAWLFSACVAVLSGAASARSRVIFSGRANRARFAYRRGWAGWKAVRRPALRILEAALWILAAATLGYCSYAYASAALHQENAKAAFNVLRTNAHSEPVSARAVEPPPEAPINGQVLGVLDIPRIGLSSIVEQGADSRVLRESVGHIPGTALPGQDGNIALAAHRDTYFRHLSELKPGEKIIFHSISATYTYDVVSTRVVQPTDTAVLAETNVPTLTLVTCYPFYYVGSAPKRFVLVAKEDPVTGDMRPR